MHTSRYVPLTLNKYHKVKHTVPVPEKQAVTLTLYWLDICFNLLKLASVHIGATWMLLSCSFEVNHCISSSLNSKHFKRRNFAAVTWTFLRSARATSKNILSFPKRTNENRDVTKKSKIFLFFLINFLVMGQYYHRNTTLWKPTNGIAADQKKSLGIKSFCLNGVNDELYYRLLFWKVILQRNRVHILKGIIKSQRKKYIRLWTHFNKLNVIQWL